MTDLTNKTYKIGDHAIKHFNDKKITRPKTCKGCEHDTNKQDELNGVICRLHGKKTCNDYRDYRVKKRK